MRDNFIIKQRNGLYCIINKEINNILKSNLTKEDLIMECINDLTCDILGEIISCEDFNERLERALIGSAKVDSDKTNIMNKIRNMSNTVSSNNFKGFKVKVLFANESLKNEFINKINHSSIFTRTSFGDSVMISEKSDKSITITIKEDTGFAPFITCIYDDKIEDNIEQNKYAFVITCSNYKNIYLVYNRIINQFKSLKEFKDDKISVISVNNNSIIVTFSKLSKYTPVFTII